MRRAGSLHFNGDQARRWLADHRPPQKVSAAKNAADLSANLDQFCRQSTVFAHYIETGDHDRERRVCPPNAPTAEFAADSLPAVNRWRV